MRVLCRHGHYAFYPERSSDVSRFANFYRVPLVRDGEFYTFEGLRGLPCYSLAGKDYGGIPAVATFAGAPWDVMRANGFVWSLSLKRIVPAATHAGIIYQMPNVGYYYAPQVRGIPQAGAMVGTTRTLSFDAIVEPTMSVRVLEYGA